MYVEMPFDAINAIKIRNTWYVIREIEYISQVLLGRVREDRVAPINFSTELELEMWIKIVTVDDETLYFPVKDITGIKSSATPLGG